MVTVIGAESKKLGDIEPQSVSEVSLAVLNMPLLKSEFDIADDANPVVVLAIVLVKNGR